MANPISAFVTALRDQCPRIGWASGSALVGVAVPAAF